MRIQDTVGGRIAFGSRIDIYADLVLTLDRQAI